MVNAADGALGRLLVDLVYPLPPAASLPPPLDIVATRDAILEASRAAAGRGVPGVRIPHARQQALWLVCTTRRARRRSRRGAPARGVFSSAACRPPRSPHRRARRRDQHFVPILYYRSSPTSGRACEYRASVERRDAADKQRKPKKSPRRARSARLGLRRAQVTKARAPALLLTPSAAPPTRFRVTARHVRARADALREKCLLPAHRIQTLSRRRKGSAQHSRPRTSALLEDSARRFFPGEA